MLQQTPFLSNPIFALSLVIPDFFFGVCVCVITIWGGGGTTPEFSD